jgi:anti-sigma regulatory factor (Ser/Thr protein kinase)
MDAAFPYTIAVRLPGDLDIIPAVRKFISETLQVSGFSAKFAFRTEIIVDAICNNAIAYGSDGDTDSNVEMKCLVHPDRVEIVVKDRGGQELHIERLKEAVSRSRHQVLPPDYDSIGMGLEIVKLLSETIELNVDEDNLTSIHVIRRREDM